jgi:uncharacterized protein (DUF1697 family)
MEKLKASLAASGFEQIQTYIQSGNVIFRSKLRNSDTVSGMIEQKIREDFSLRITVLSRTVDEMGAIIKANPFLQQKGVDSTKLHVTFLSQAPVPSCLDKLAALANTGDEFRHSGHEVYLYCPNGYGRTKLSNNVLEKVLMARASTRNWRTVNQLYQMALGYR